MLVFLSQSLCSFWWVTGLVVFLHDQGETGCLQSWTEECTGYRNREAPHWLKRCNTISVHICVCVNTSCPLTRPPPRPTFQCRALGGRAGWLPPDHQQVLPQPYHHQGVLHSSAQLRGTKDLPHLLTRLLPPQSSV